MIGQFQLALRASPLGAEVRPNDLEGCRLYSPWALLWFAFLGNLPAGIVLLGINLRRRRRRGLGNAALLLGGAGCLLLMAAIFEADRPPDLRLFGFFGGLLLFAIEKPAFQVALQSGATRARWWPPWLVLLGILAVTAAIAAWLR